ncbi:MAG: alpha-L-fucosidase [Planctomycetes bacterium]|nr:alpha-L-fucosidase [Planctomycetota bacterium]
MIRETIGSALIFFTALCGAGMSQHDEKGYVPVQDPLIREKLEKWQDLKFGLFMHWGPYSQWGVVESWSICNEDWIERTQGRHENYTDYKEDYRNLRKTFDPRGFDPAKWAKAAQEAGMGYLVFTTKHHDGFCMFDTKETDYKITSKECPFHESENADITRALFDAFREQGFMVGAYFSKPDWDCPYYWWPYYATPDRHVNYDPARYPDRWRKFEDFTFAQIEELMTGYGPVDLLWLDGAWVRPIENMPEAYASWAKKKNYNQAIDMAGIARMARGHQPGLIIVDRWVSGEFENYLTPEQRIPEQAITVPWESCITMAEGWSYHPRHRYKSVRELIGLLVKIVSKGGNFLLNIGPSPEGDWAEEAYDRLEGIGKWMKINGQAIHQTRARVPYQEGNIHWTQGKEGSLYAIYLNKGDEKADELPKEIRLSSIQPEKGTTITLLGSEQMIRWEKTEKGCVVFIPEEVRNDPPCEHAWVLRINR